MGTRDRTITVTFKGTAAYEFASNPNYPDVWEEYGVDSQIFEGEGGYETGGLDVTSVS